MKFELASAPLRRARGAAMRRSMNELADRLFLSAPSGKRLARPRQNTRKPDYTQTLGSPS